MNLLALKVRCIGIAGFWSLRDDDPQYNVDDQSDSEDDEQGHQNTNQRRVDLEVCCDTSADASDNLVVAATIKFAVTWGVCRFFRCQTAAGFPELLGVSDNGYGSMDQ